MVNTHYFYRPPILDAKAFRAFSADVGKLVAAAPANIVLCGREGTGSPEVTAHCVSFNGDAAVGMEHEPFVIEAAYTLRPPSRIRDGVFFDFCKTHGKPYDLIMVASLYAFLHRFPACKFSSDSSMDELRPGFDLFRKICEPTGDMDALFLRPQIDKT